MYTVAPTRMLQKLAREAEDALARCEDVRLEEILANIKAFSKGMCWSLNSASGLKVELDAIKLILDATKETGRILRGYRSPVQESLEYRQSVKPGPSGALY